MVTRFTAALAIALASAGAMGSALAQKVELVANPQASASDPGTEVRTTDRIGRAFITLKNTGDAPLTVRPDMNWRQLANGSLHAAKWSVPQSGTQPESGAFTIAKDTTTAFMVEGQFDAIGTYVVGLTVSANVGGGAAAPSEKRFTLSVTRTMAAVPANLLIEPRPARINLGFWDAATKSQRVLGVSAQNAGTDPVLLGGPTVTRFVALEGDTEISVALRGRASVAPGDCAAELTPKKDCTLDVTLPEGLPPGRYAVDVALSGLGGGRTMASVRVDIRRSAWFAAMLVGIGALAGYLVVYWRERGRTGIERRISVAELQGRISKLVVDAKSSLVQARAKGLLDSARALEATVSAGGDPSADLAAIGGRYTALAAAEQALLRAEHPDLRPMFDELGKRLKSELQSDQWNVDNVNAAVQRIQAELAILPDLSVAATLMDGARKELEPVLPWLSGPHAETAAAAKAAHGKAFTKIEQTEGTTAEPALKRRLVAVNEARAKLDELPKAAVASLAHAVGELIATNPSNKQALQEFQKELNEALTKETIAPDRAAALIERAYTLGVPRKATREAVAADTPPAPQPAPATPAELDFDVLRYLGSLSPRQLRWIHLFWSFMTNAIVLVGISLTGIPVLWANTPAWGSTTDVVTALLAGAGTRLAIGRVTRPQT